MKVTDVPFNPTDLTRINVSDYEVRETGRRFNRCGGEYLEIKDKDSPIYEYAQFGELKMEYRRQGTHRVQRLTVLYARIAELNEFQSVIQCES